MEPQKNTGLVLQGGGALGAYELGAARRLYRDAGFNPGLIAGVSIGAITAVLLARPDGGMKPLEALEKFWEMVTVSGWFLPPPLQEYASALGNPHFFMPRLDLLNISNWNYIYDTAPLKATLAQLVDVKALAAKDTLPRLLVSATDIEAGKIRYFDSHEDTLTLNHILASGSLPPSFPMTKIDGREYWDGGLFDNTPLGAVIDLLEPVAGQQSKIYVVNLFPNKAKIPGTLLEVYERMTNLQFANKTCEDVKLMRRFNAVVDLVTALDALPANDPIFSHKAVTEALAAIKNEHYKAVPDIIDITRPEQVGGFDGSDFSRETIKRRAAEGYRQAGKALGDK